MLKVRLTIHVARIVKRITTSFYKKFVETFKEQPDADRDKQGSASKRIKTVPRERSDQEVEVDIDALKREMRSMNVQPDEDEDSGEEFARQIEGELLTACSDEEMEDVSTKAKTEQEIVDEAWAAFDKAITEDPTLVPKPQPRVIEDRLRMPRQTPRKRNLAEELAEITSSPAKYLIDLDVSFDMSNAPKYLQTQKMHYGLYGHDAKTIKDLFDTLWLENREWLIHYGYSRERVQRVKRLEITLFIKEGKELKYTHRWTIKGDFDGKEQGEAWKNFLETANRWGEKEALNQLSITEREERAERKWRPKDNLGNMYDRGGNYIRRRKPMVHAHVDVEIVLFFG